MILKLLRQVDFHVRGIRGTAVEEITAEFFPVELRVAVEEQQTGAQVVEQSEIVTLGQGAGGPDVPAAVHDGQRIKDDRKFRGSGPDAVRGGILGGIARASAFVRLPEMRISVLHKGHSILFHLLDLISAFAPQKTQRY